jgi:GH25 family lysozyme M1 (1,4-beta-N-acetylmuramidase)
MNSPFRSVPRRASAATAVLVAALGLTVGQPTPPPVDDAAPAAAAVGGHSWARTATGEIAEVTPTHSDTPVHPEAITHPDLDAMGGDASRADAVLAAATKPLPGAAGLGKVVPNPISPASAIPQLPGIDVSSHQGAINWASVAPHIDFVYAKATEGTYYRNVDFTNQYNGPYKAGLIRGAYHFAIPSNSSGTVQADYFVAHGGGWSGDGRTLPGALDIEYNPYGSSCYGLTPSQMTAWIGDFVTEYAAREHAYPVIYSNTNWWKSCTGNTAKFASLDPFWVANYASAGGGTLPAGWSFYTFWQYADSGPQPGDQDVFNGAMTQLKKLASKG